MVVKDRQYFLAAFQYHNFRHLWGSGVSLFTAFWMELVVTGWLILELTNSPALVGLVGACRYAGMGLGPFFGALADHFDRRRILLASQLAGSVFTIALAALYYASLLQVWHIFTVVLLGGAVRGCSQTTTYALVPDSVDSHNLASAVGMLMIGMGATSVIGPLVGGYVYGYVGAGGCFAIMGGTYLYAWFSILPLHVTRRENPARLESVWKSVMDGIHYVREERALLALMIFAAIANLFIFPCVMDTMPVFARNVLRVEVSGLGWLIATQGIGRLAGALVASTLDRHQSKGWILTILMIVWPVMLGTFASSHTYYASIILIGIAGLSQGLAMSLIQLLLLMWSSPAFHGRVMGVRMLVIICEMIGSIITGALASIWGIASIFVINAILCLLGSVLISVWIPQLHNRQ